MLKINHNTKKDKIEWTERQPQHIFSVLMVMSGCELVADDQS
jgi:hypothetical protein